MWLGRRAEIEILDHLHGAHAGRERGQRHGDLAVGDRVGDDEHVAELEFRDRAAEAVSLEREEAARRHQGGIDGFDERRLEGHDKDPRFAHRQGGDRDDFLLDQHHGGAVGRGQGVRNLVKDRPELGELLERKRER